MITIKENQTLIAKFTIIEGESFKGEFEVKEKCGYCREPYTPLINYEDFYVKFISKSVLSIEFCRAGYEYNDTGEIELKINNCPMCGRELNI